MIRWCVILGTCCLAVTAAEASGAPPDPMEAARDVDRQLSDELPLADKVAPRCDDTTYLRRVTLDLVGRNPTVEEITAFALDPAEDKRRRVVERLLANPEYGTNWARYWRDVILSRRAENRALLSARPMTDYLAEAFNRNRPWNEIAASFITAEGDVTENGATGLFMAQQGVPEETTAEIARIFLGIQIQCAQCHDHPTDRWKREEFHQLAAFLPRVAVRPVRDAERPTFEVVGEDNFPRFARRNNNNRIRGTAEHRMPDLDNPAAQGTLMKPVFFLTGQQLPLGTRDATRRATLAEWLTARENPWFAKALVNRLWSELVGEGFYEPVDDMGPDRECSAPQTLDLLAQGFIASGYDVKWLLTTIIATDAYQRESASRRDPDELPYRANVAQRLRADQVFNNLAAVLNLAEGPAARQRGAFGQGRGPRALFSATFEYDPSLPRDEVTGSIPQALAMMNSPIVNAGISGRGRSVLARLLTEIDDDRQLVIELYLRTLAREPSSSEIATCLAHVKETSSRREAFEDIQWALINSTEFLHRQ